MTIAKEDVIFAIASSLFRLQSILYGDHRVSTFIGVYFFHGSSIIFPPFNFDESTDKPLEITRVNISREQFLYKFDVFFLLKVMR